MVYYYDEYDELVGDIQFYNPLRTFDNFELIPKKKTLANAIAIEIKPKNKSLIFFPSFLHIESLLIVVKDQDTNSI